MLFTLSVDVDGLSIVQKHQAAELTSGVQTVDRQATDCAGSTHTDTVNVCNTLTISTTEVF